MPPLRQALKSSPIALFLLGPGGSGKTTLAEELVRRKTAEGQGWCLIDKDIVGEIFVPKMLRLQGLDPHDRDSPQYMNAMRDMEYRACLVLAAHQLRLGVNVVLPAPWTKELETGALFDEEALGLKGFRLVHASLAIEDQLLLERVRHRNAPRDALKLIDWPRFMQRSTASTNLSLAKGVPQLSSGWPLAKKVEALLALVEG